MLECLSQSGKDGAEHGSMCKGNKLSWFFSTNGSIGQLFAGQLNVQVPEFGYWCTMACQDAVTIMCDGNICGSEGHIASGIA